MRRQEALDVALLLALAALALLALPAAIDWLVGVMLCWLFALG